MAQEAIVYNYSAIAKRAAEISQKQQVQRFALPDGVVIVLAARITPGTRLPNCDLCLVFNHVTGRLLVENPRSTDRERILAFAQYLARYYPSLRMLSAYEMSLSPEDAADFASRLVPSF